MGAAGVKVYDKFSRVLRIEPTVNDVSFFKHHRKVEHKGAAATRELAPLKKSIYGLIDLREILLGCNQRYLAFLSSLDDPSAGERDLQRLSQPRLGADPSIKGLNFFGATDGKLLRTLQHGEFNIHGWRRADLVARLQLVPSAMTRQLRRLRTLGLIKKVTHTYRYYLNLTRLGRAAIAAACSLTRFNIVPAMPAAHRSLLKKRQNSSVWGLEAYGCNQGVPSGAGRAIRRSVSSFQPECHRRAVRMNST
jgi:DNA-binding MarR family transcriptional regulator